ncbi:hypothetical protein [Pseudarthrobacter sp. SSS035]|nr:hypothetical protein [Pseudarthrobacter sp. SSS035]
MDTVAFPGYTLASGASRDVGIHSTHDQGICPRHGLWICAGATGFAD